MATILCWKDWHEKRVGGDRTGWPARRCFGHYGCTRLLWLARGEADPHTAIDCQRFTWSSSFSRRHGNRGARVAIALLNRLWRCRRLLFRSAEDTLLAPLSHHFRVALR